jgi:hypothetical protein
MHSQGQFNFDAGESQTGHTHWLEGRQMAAEALARQMNLPLGHQVEVWLHGGVRLRGKLRFRRRYSLSRRSACGTSGCWSITSHSPTGKWNRACGSIESLVGCFR